MGLYTGGAYLHLGVKSMVEFVPFAGYAPVLRDGEKIGDRIAPSFAAEGAIGDLRGHHCNVTRFTSGIENGRYLNCSRELSEAIENGDLAQDSESFYVYRQTIGTSVRIGIIGSMRLSAYDCNGVMPMESVSSKNRNDRLALLKDTCTDSEPVLGIIQSMTDSLRTRIQEAGEPVFEFTDSDGFKHEILRVSDINITSAITAEIADQRVMIAGGQSEYEAALAHSQEDPGSVSRSYVMTLLLPADDAGLALRPMHRLVKAGDIGETSAIKKICKTAETEIFEIGAHMISELGNHTFGIAFRSGRGMVVDPKTIGDSPLSGYDVHVAQETVLNGVYKADEGKSKITYCADMIKATELLGTGGYDLAVLFNEPDLDRIWHIVFSGKRIPKHSVSFGPPFLSGFVYRRIE